MSAQQGVGRMTVTEARANFKAVLERVQKGEEVELTRGGRPVAVLIRPDRLRLRRISPTMAAAQQRLDEMRRARRDPPPLTEGLTPERAEGLIREVREDRESR